jgi:hypothetical protein
MANILKLQDQLKGLPDRALMQYAQNPTGQVPQYLVLGELQRRKNMRDEFQQSQAQAPQKTVAEELAGGVAQLQPMMGGQPGPQPQPAPQGGVAALPVPETMFQEQSMAGGGIVAFEEGGYVPRYAGETDGSLITSSPLGRYASSVFNPEPLLNPAIKAGAKGYEERLRQINKRLTELGGSFGLRQQNPAEIREYDALKEEKQRVTNQLRSLPSDVKSALYYTPGAETVPEQKTGPAAAGPAAPPPPDGGIANLARPPAPSVPGSGGISTKLGRATSVYTPEVLADLEKSRAPIYLDESKYVPAELSVDEATKRVKDVQAAFGVSEAPYEEQKGRLKKREADIETRRAQSVWEAVMRAGFATAAGTSPFALTNLGKGALEGLQSYTDARDKLDASQEKLDAAQFALTDAQNRFRQEGSKEAGAELRDNRKEVRDAKRELARDKVAADRQARVFERSDVQAQLTDQGRVQTFNLSQEAAERDLAIKLRQLDISKLSAEAQAAAAARPTQASFIIDNAKQMFPNDIARQTEYAAEQFAKMGGTSTLEAAKLRARDKAIERASLRPDYIKAVKAGDKNAQNDILNEEINRVLSTESALGTSGIAGTYNPKTGKIE